MTVTPTRSPAAAVELAPGAIRPTGWLLDQLRLQAEGQTGRLEDIWPDVGPDSGWRGGDGEDWERGPYYLDGLVPLAYVLDDPGLIAKVRPWVEWILASQREDGYFGPASNDDWWPRMVAAKALVSYADATGDDRVPDFLARYFRYQLDHLPERPLRSWGRVRAADNTLSVWWLHERTGEPWLLDLVDLLAAQTADWEGYLTQDLITGKATFFDHLTHGPNVAMGLKTGAVAFLRDGDPAHRERTEASFAALDRWHGQVHGWFSGDEFLGGREATAGIETCQVVEMMFSCEQLARIYGGGVYGDRLESLAFNLLAASSDAQVLAHQYHQQANQVQVSVGRREWTYSGDDANIFGHEPHFGCCTANLHQGWPKFVRSLWSAVPDGLMAVAYAPCEVSATVAGAAVRLEVRTAYPFEDLVAIAVDVEEPTEFGLRLRIPGWCPDWTLTVNGSPVGATTEDGYVVLRRTWRSGDLVELTLPMRTRLVRRERQAVGVAYGPLTMVLRIGENWRPVIGAPPETEWEVHPRKSWNYGLVDPWRRHRDWPVERRPVGPVPFLLADAPIRIRTDGAHVDAWRLDGVQAGTVPDGPVFCSNVTDPLTLVPYGSARLRIAEFPTVRTVPLAADD